MGNTQMLQWALWGLSLLGGVGATLAFFKLDFLQRYIPTKEEADRLQAIVPVLQEEQRQLREAIDARQQEIAQLEATVGHLRILKKWQEEHPEAAVLIQQMMTDLERCKAELAAVQQKLAQEEARLTQIAQEAKLFAQEKQTLEQQKVSLEKEAAALRETLKSLTQNIKDTETRLRELEEKRRQMDRDTKDLDTMMQQEQKRLVTLRQQVQQVEQEKAAAQRDRDQARADCNAAKAELTGLQKSLDIYKALVENLNTQLKQASVGHTDIAKALEDLSGSQPVGTRKPP